MRTHRTISWSAGAAALLLGLAACSSGTPSTSPAAPTASSEDSVPAIEIVSDPSSIGQPISLDIPLDESGAFVFDQWPSACEIADETTLSSIFPQADDIVQAPSERSLSIFSLGAGTRKVTVPEASCTTKIGFPFEGLGAGDQNVVFMVTTTVESAGDPEFVTSNSPKKGGEVTQIGGASCVVSAEGLRYDCQTQNISFNFTLDARPFGQYFGEGESTYVIDGEEVMFSGDVQPFLAMAREKILVPLVEASVERLS